MLDHIYWTINVGPYILDCVDGSQVVDVHSAHCVRCALMGRRWSMCTVCAVCSRAAAAASGTPCGLHTLAGPLAGV